MEKENNLLIKMPLRYEPLRKNRFRRNQLETTEKEEVVQFLSHSTWSGSLSHKKNMIHLIEMCDPQGIVINTYLEEITITPIDNVDEFLDSKKLKKTKSVLLSHDLYFTPYETNPK
jgi:hypothetical protein